MSNPAEARLLAIPIATAPGSGIANPGCPDSACRRGQIAQSAYEGILAFFAAGSKDA
jgi:hypothetical protein